MLKARLKRISQQEKDELAEVLYSISEEEEREVLENFTSSRSSDWDDDSRYESFNF